MQIKNEKTMNVNFKYRTPKAKQIPNLRHQIIDETFQFAKDDFVKDSLKLLVILSV